MKKIDKLVTNSMGKRVPSEVNGKPAIPFRGVGKYFPNRWKQTCWLIKGITGKCRIE